MQVYLESSEFIDWHHPDFLAQATDLAGNCTDRMQIAQRCFEFVRDQIRHSWDFKLNPVTCRASDVLHHRTGYCYAKSHLLAALLRANGIPAGLCYQRLSIEGCGPPFCLHGLNAVFLEEYGWYRIDPRGNKPGVQADFTPPTERLAFAVTAEGEVDLPEIWPEPLPVVVTTLLRCGTYEDVCQNLPDLQVFGQRQEAEA